MPLIRGAPSAGEMTYYGSAARILRWFKYYIVINGFISAVAFASSGLLSASPVVLSPLVLYGVSLARILLMVRWFGWIETKKTKILGDKRHTLTPTQRRAIYFRILWLVVPTECLSFYMAIPTSTSLPSDIVSFLLECITFIPKSLVFEVAFDLFHYIAHWWCHQLSWLYQHVHKRHHWHLHPCALSTYEQDGIDLLLTNVLPFVLATQLSPAFSPFQLHLLFAYKTYVEVAGHSGLEIKGFSFPQLPLVNVLGICLRVHDHDLHHMHPKCNFAKRFALWDKLFGTFQPGRPLDELASASTPSKR